MDTITIDDLAVGFRDATPADEGVVFHAWLVAHRKHGDWPPRLSSRRYFDEHKLVIAEILARPRTRTIVACDPARPELVYGFVCAERGVLHWLYVKESMQGNGLGRALLERAGLAAGAVCSHWTRTATRLVKRGAPWRYDPFLLEVRS